MSKVDDPQPEVVKPIVYDHLREQNTSEPRERKSGIEWLRDKLDRSGLTYSNHPDCGAHYHAECMECGATKCLGQSGYSRYETVTHLCDCSDGLGDHKTDHLIVPFDTFGRYFGFPD